jgi:hypothetical protein
MKIIILIPISVIVIYMSLFVIARAGLNNNPQIDKFKFAVLGKDGEVMTGGSYDLDSVGGYGWACDVRTTNDSLEWLEELKIPIKPQTWENQALVNVSKDGRVAYCKGGFSDQFPSTGTIFDKIMFIKTKTMYHSWGVADGDPRGEYQFTVKIGGKVFIQSIVLK